MPAAYFHLQQTSWHSHTTQGVRSRFHVHSPLQIHQLWKWNYKTQVSYIHSIKMVSIWITSIRTQCHQPSCDTTKTVSASHFEISHSLWLDKASFLHVTLKIFTPKIGYKLVSRVNYSRRFLWDSERYIHLFSKIHLVSRFFRFEWKDSGKIDRICSGEVKFWYTTWCESMWKAVSNCRWIKKLRKY